MGGIFSSPKPPAPPPPPPPPGESEASKAAVKTAETAAKKRARAQAGKASTILTSSQGVLGEANTQKKTLLGS